MYLGWWKYIILCNSETLYSACILLELEAGSISLLSLFIVNKFHLFAQFAYTTIKLQV